MRIISPLRVIRNNWLSVDNILSYATVDLVHVMSLHRIICNNWFSVDNESI